MMCTQSVDARANGEGHRRVGSTQRFSHRHVEIRKFHEFIVVGISRTAVRRLKKFGAKFILYRRMFREKRENARQCVGCGIHSCKNERAIPWGLSVQHWCEDARALRSGGSNLEHEEMVSMLENATSGGS